MDHVEYDFMLGMDESEVERYLRDHDAGVIALAREGDAYAVPVSYEYEDGRLFVRLAHDADSRKVEFLQATGEACFVVHDVDDGAWSVVATGPLRDVTGEPLPVFDDAAINEAFGPLHLFDQAVEDVDVRVYELDVRLVTGRKVNR